MGGADISEAGRRMSRALFQVDLASGENEQWYSIVKTKFVFSTNCFRTCNKPQLFFKELTTKLDLVFKTDKIFGSVRVSPY